MWLNVTCRLLVKQGELRSKVLLITSLAFTQQYAFEVELKPILSIDGSEKSLKL
jgi:hypothetical protein